MTVKEDIWRAFVKARKLEVVRVDFASRKKVYVGMSGKEMTQEEIMGTHSYEGFTDGYCGNRHLYRGPKGVRDDEIKPIETARYMISEAQNIALRNEEGDKLEEILAFFEDKFPQGLYDFHYDLGINSKSIPKRPL